MTDKAVFSDIRPEAYPLFQGIRREEQEKMFACLQVVRRNYPKGSFVILDEDDVPHVCMILQGSVYMLKEDVAGMQTLLITMYRGELFGETYALSKQVAHVSFQAAEDLEILLLPLEKALYTCERTCPFHQTLVRNCFRMITDKNRRLIEKLEILSRDTLRGKILCFLQQQAASQGTDAVRIALSRTGMAAYLNSNRSALSRELSRMQKEGILRIEGEIFHICRD